MSRKNLVSPWKSGHDEDEVSVPTLLRTTLRASRALGVTPARLWRARAGWRLAVSAPLAALQRLIVIFTTVIVLSAFVKDFLFDDNYSHVHVSKAMTEILNIGEQALVMFVYAFGVWTGPKQLKKVIFLLRHMQKINTSLNHDTLIRDRETRSSEVSVKWLILYVIWLTISCMEDFAWMLANRKHGQNELDISLYGPFYYQFLMLQMLQLQWSMTILELNSTLTFVNDQLEYLLQIQLAIPTLWKVQQHGFKPTFVNIELGRIELFCHKVPIPTFRLHHQISSMITFHAAPALASTDLKTKLYLTELIPQKVKRPSSSMQGNTAIRGDIGRIHHFNQCHELICDMVTKVNHDDGPFLLLSFMLVFLQLLITPHNFLLGLDVYGINHIIRQTNWSLIHLFQLLMLVEPCHRLRDQMERTRSLLSSAVGDRRRTCDTTELELFVLQVQMRDAALTPMGVFTIARPIVASILGGVATYLIIVIQIQKASDPL